MHSILMKYSSWSISMKTYVYCLLTCILYKGHIFRVFVHQCMLYCWCWHVNKYIVTSVSCQLFDRLWEIGGTLWHETFWNHNLNVWNDEPWLRLASLLGDPLLSLKVSCLPAFLPNTIVPFSCNHPCVVFSALTFQRSGLSVVEVVVSNIPAI